MTDMDEASVYGVRGIGLRVECGWGAPILRIAEEMCQLSKCLNISVVGIFNGVRLWADPDSIPDNIVRLYRGIK
jgi:hypothetical protein